eukprot:1139101-Pelagomonas_calceolata.AAC.3
MGAGQSAGGLMKECAQRVCQAAGLMHAELMCLCRGLNFKEEGKQGVAQGQGHQCGTDEWRAVSWRPEREGPRSWAASWKGRRVSWVRGGGEPRPLVNHEASVQLGIRPWTIAKMQSPVPACVGSLAGAENGACNHTSLSWRTGTKYDSQSQHFRHAESIIGRIGLQHVFRLGVYGAQIKQLKKTPGAWPPEFGHKGAQVSTIQ